TARRLDSLERHFAALAVGVVKTRSRLMSEMENVNAKLDRLGEVVASAKSAIDQLKAAVDYLKSHPVVMEDPGLKAVSDKLDAIGADLAEKVAASGASGSV